MLEDPHIGFGKNVFKHNQSDCMEVMHISAGWYRGCTSHKHAIADLVYRHGKPKRMIMMVVKETMMECMEGMVIKCGVNQSKTIQCHWSARQTP